jgi:hypothetical protein
MICIVICENRYTIVKNYQKRKSITNQNQIYYEKIIVSC